MKKARLVESVLPYQPKNFRTSLFRLHSVLFTTAILFFLIFPVFALKIGIIGDQTGSPDIDKSYLVLHSACEQMSRNNPDIVLHAGDLVESTMDEKNITGYFERGTGFLTQIKNSQGIQVPWYMTAGDHDVNPPVFSPGSADNSRAILFRKLLDDKYKELYKTSAPDLNGNLYYSFNFKGYHFICLYAEDTLCVDPRWGDLFMAKISERQFLWLKNDLEKTERSNGTIVFLHQPLWYNRTMWDVVHRLLSKHNVIAVIAGHFHYSQVEDPVDNIRYIVVGASGGSLKDSSDNAGGIPVITILNVDSDSKINIETCGIYSGAPSKPPKRKEMDRVQALDNMLSSVSHDDKSSVVNDILGNPIDIPINVYITRETDPPKWQLYRTYKPGEGIMYSNLSSVELVNKNVPSEIKGVQIIFSSNDKKNSQFRLQKIF